MTMKAELINPFLRSVHDVFNKMMDCKVKQGKIGLATGTEEKEEISALIGLSGSTRGFVSLSLTDEVAVAIVSRMLNADSQQLDSTIFDGVAELVNMIGGSAKSKLSKEDETPIDLGLPTVIRGNNYRILNLSHTVWVEIPFESELGSFKLQLTFEESAEE